MADDASTITVKSPQIKMVRRKLKLQANTAKLPLKPKTALFSRLARAKG
jgi:hypothetical protein